MTDGKGKRAVIISNIKSGTIEQAIFILKSPTYESNISAGSGIVAEAQEIINNYIYKMEGIKTARKRKNFLKYIGAIVMALTAFAVMTATALLVLR